MDRLIGSVYPEMRRRYPWMKTHQSLGRMNFSFAIGPMRKTPPCGFCVKNGKVITVDKPSRACVSCRTVFYCGKECQASDWKDHKAYCKGDGVARREVCDLMWKSGLFTSSCGRHVNCVPCEPKTDGVDGSQMAYVVNKIRTFPMKMSDLISPDIIIFTLAPPIIKEMGFSPTIRDLTSTTRHLHHIYHVPMWKDIDDVYDRLTERGITVVKDPLCGTGLFVAMMATKGMATEASDITRWDHAIHSDIKIMDAREAIMATKNPKTTAIVLSWPDDCKSESPHLSEVVIDASEEMGIPVLIVMTDTGGVAMDKGSHAILIEAYFKIAEYGTHYVSGDAFLALAMMYDAESVEDEIKVSPSLGRMSQTTSVWIKRAYK